MSDESKPGSGSTAAPSNSTPGVANPSTPTSATAAPSGVAPAGSPTVGTATAGTGVLTLTIKDKAVLYASYMSFLKEGGLFIPTARPFNMGEEISMVLHLIDETEKFPVTGTVVWITPKGAQGNRAPGIGVQFKGEEGKLVRNKIETYLAGALKSDKPTHSM